MGTATAHVDTGVKAEVATVIQGGRTVFSINGVGHWRVKNQKHLTPTSTYIPSSSGHGVLDLNGQDRGIKLPEQGGQNIPHRPNQDCFSTAYKVRVVFTFLNG